MVERDTLAVRRSNAPNSGQIGRWPDRFVNGLLKAGLVTGEQAACAYRRRPSNARLAPERLAELARGFTVAVHCWE